MEESWNSAIKKMSTGILGLDASTLLVGTLMIGGATLLIGGIDDQVIDPSALILSIVVGILVYFYLKRRFHREMSRLRAQTVLLKQQADLDEMCADPETKNKETCKRYKEAKANFFTISNMLLQQVR